MIFPIGYLRGKGSASNKDTTCHEDNNTSTCNPHPVLVTSDLELDIPDVNNILNSTELEVSDSENRGVAKFLFEDSTENIENHSFRRPQPVYGKHHNLPEGYKARRTLSSARFKSCSTRFLNCISSDDEDPFDYDTQTLPKRRATTVFGEKRSKSSINLASSKPKVRRNGSLRTPTINH